MRGQHNTTPRAPPPLDAALHLHLAVGHLHLSLSLPRGLPKGCVGERDLTTVARRRATEFLDPCPMPSTSAILAGTGIPRVIVISIRVRVRGGAARVVPKSLLQDLNRP
jgi:hypothetical protein